MPNFLQGLVLTVALVIAGFGWHMIYERFADGMVHSAEMSDQMRRQTESAVSMTPANVSEVKSWYAYNEPLPLGYKCSAADGGSYRT